MGMVSPLTNIQFRRLNCNHKCALTAYGCAVHNLELGDRLALVILVRWRACCLAPDDRELHVLDLNSNQQEVDLADDDVLQMVPVTRSVKAGSSRDTVTHLDLLYSNSMCKQSSIPTSILMELLLSGGMRKEWTQISLSFTTSAMRRAIVTRMKYLHSKDSVDIRSTSYTGRT
jgi:hypothetical protein